MSARFRWTSSRLLVLLFPVAVGCSTTTAPPPRPDAGADAGQDAGADAGSDAGGDAGVVACLPLGAPCPSATGQCCGNLLCQAGACAEPAPTCAGYAEPCGQSMTCCNPKTDGGTPLQCVTLDAGLAICLNGSQGSGCQTNTDCASPLTCLDAGVCDFPNSGNTCTGTACHPGDDCSAQASQIENNGTSSDPCFSSGLTCFVFDDLTGTQQVRCLTPTVNQPPAWPSPDGPLFDGTICNPENPICASDTFGAPRSPPACGNYFFGGDSYCMETCTTGDDCDSILWDCVQGTCKPNYCFAAGDTTDQDGGTVTWAAELSPYQVANGGLPISGDPAVLFNPCALDAGFPTACLPQYDEFTGVSSGTCIRVGAADAGGFGAFCDPTPYRNNLEGLCAAGTFCDKGTCLPWCDLDTTSFIQCPGGLTCSRLPPTGPFLSSASGGTNALGVCAENCDPYQDALHNTCLPFGTDAGQPPLGCKFSESQNDVTPSPGICLAQVAQPIPVGEPCAPFGWEDPCVSGAECIQTNGADSGITFVCSQLCDPQPSPGVNEPSCGGGKTCVGFQTCNLSAGCAHEGACQ